MDMTAVAQPVASGVHLVGSVPLASPGAVFRANAAEIGDRVRRTPDGYAGDAHQAGHALAADVHAVGGQLGMHAGHPVGPARAGMNGLIPARISG